MKLQKFKDFLQIVRKRLCYILLKMRYVYGAIQMD